MLRNLWQIILLGCAVVFRGESLINFHGLSDHLMRINYMISSVLSDISLIVLLIYFTPGGKFFQGRGWSILIVYIIVKALVYLMIYIHGLQSAKEINAKLNGN